MACSACEAAAKQRALQHRQQAQSYKRATLAPSRTIKQVSTQADCFTEPSCDPKPNPCRPECEGLKSCFNGTWLEPFFGTVKPLSYHFDDATKSFTLGFFPTTEENMSLVTVANPDFNPHEPISVTNPKMKWELHKILDGCGEQSLFLDGDYLAISQRNLPTTVYCKVSLDPLIIKALEKLPGYGAGKHLVTYDNDGYVDMQWVTDYNWQESNTIAIEDTGDSYIAHVKVSDRKANLITADDTATYQGMYATLDLRYDPERDIFYFLDATGSEQILSYLSPLQGVVKSIDTATFYEKKEVSLVPTADRVTYAAAGVEIITQDNIDYYYYLIEIVYTDITGATHTVPLAANKLGKTYFFPETDTISPVIEQDNNNFTVANNVKVDGIEGNLITVHETFGIFATLKLVYQNGVLKFLDANGNVISGTEFNLLNKLVSTDSIVVTQNGDVNEPTLRISPKRENLLTVYTDNANRGVYASFTSQYGDDGFLRFYDQAGTEITGARTKIPAVSGLDSGRYYARSPQTVAWYQANNPTEYGNFISSNVAQKTLDGQVYFVEYIDITAETTTGEHFHIYIPAQDLMTDYEFKTTSTVQVDIVEDGDNTIDIKHSVRISAEEGNIIKEKSDGIYAIADKLYPATYDDDPEAKLGGVMVDHNSDLTIDENGILSFVMPDCGDAGFVEVTEFYEP